MATTDVVEKDAKVELGGHIVYFRISIGSTFTIGVGPRPKRNEIYFARRIDGGQLLAVGIDVSRLSAKGIAKKKAVSARKASGTTVKKAAKSFRVGTGRRTGGG